MYEDITEKPERKGPLGSFGCRWEDNFKIALTETVMQGVS
jgi:hypothetical protein